MKVKMMQALALALFGVVMAATSAQAISYNLDVDHCTGGCGTMPAGTVDLTQSGTTVDVTVNLLNNNLFVKSGAGDFMNFKFNGVGVSAGDITIDLHTPNLSLFTGAFDGNGTGLFSFGISCSSCKNGLTGAFASNIVFHVADATIADLTNPNNLGFLFAADVYSLETGNTGPVGATGSSTSVPEPTSLLLLGAGLAGLGIVRRKLE